jgi:hypothetical protein
MAVSKKVEIRLPVSPARRLKKSMDDHTPPLTPAELDRAGARMVRHAFVLLGLIDVSEMTASEVETHLRWRLSQAPNPPASSRSTPSRRPT